MGHVKNTLTDDLKAQKVLGFQGSKPNSNDIWAFLQFLKMQNLVNIFKCIKFIRLT